MLNKIDAGETPVINGDGTQAYDFITVQDVARCNVLAMEAEIQDEFYNVGTGIQTTIKQLCDLILELKNSELRVMYKPYSDEDARRLVQNRIGSTDKAETDLGFKFGDDLRAGLTSLIEWRDSN
jgi:UDP-glucose 4-epimerase